MITYFLYFFLYFTFYISLIHIKYILIKNFIYIYIYNPKKNLYKII